MKTNALRINLCAALIAFTGNAFAAGDQASADSEITLTIPEAIYIDGLADIDLTAAAGSDATGFDDFCVGGTGFPTFSIQFDSANGAGSGFALKETGGNTLPYTVGFANDISGSGHTTPNDGELLTNNTRNAHTCSATGTDNAQLLITVAQNTWQNAIGGSTYSDTLNVTVTAE